ncbi:ABC transporter permease [Anoxynatronum sibiricum]|uniref:ABC transporter permease n=1 Tax=Anoxynatronum sibiricum TaxID=210623 RepID=A0ABU9VR71_9CLOT
MDKRKAAGRLLTLWVILTLNFALPRLMPGDPFLHMSGESGDVFTTYTREQADYYRHYYGLDEPLIRQYGHYWWGIIKGDLGYSYAFKQPVSEMIRRRLPWTLLLTTGALLVSLAAGTLLGAWSAWKGSRWQDGLFYTGFMVISEIPAFLVGLALLVTLAAGKSWFPLSGAKTHFVVYESWWQQMGDIGRHAVLPILTLGLTRTGGIYLLVRNSLRTVLTKDYIRTAKAKGLRHRILMVHHALRNAMIPLVTRVAMQLGTLVGGAVLAENVFQYPGLGTLMSRAVTARDFPLLQGVFLVMTLGVLSANWLADWLYQQVDPRLKNNHASRQKGEAA